MKSGWLFARTWFLALCMASSGPALAAYPDRPVKIVHAYPGAPMDAALRLLAERLTQVWKQTVIVEPRPGASEIIAGEQVAKSSPDGHTLLVSSDSNFSLNQYLFEKLPFSPERDLVPVTQLFEIPLCLMVSAALPVTNLNEFVAEAKAKSLLYASAGVGTFNHLAMESVSRQLKISMQHVPYKAGGAALQDLGNGLIQAYVAGINAPAALVRAGRARILAVSGTHRQASAPSVPTFAEAGFPGVSISTYFGVAVARGTPAPVVDKIATDIRAILLSDDYRQRVASLYGYESVGSDPAEFAAVLARKRTAARELIRSLNLKLD